MQVPIRVGDDHGSSFYVMLVAADLSSKRSYVCHPLSGKAAIEFRSFTVCLLFCAIIMVIKERKAPMLHV